MKGKRKIINLGKMQRRNTMFALEFYHMVRSLKVGEKAKLSLPDREIIVEVFKTA